VPIINRFAEHRGGRCGEYRMTSALDMTVQSSNSVFENVRRYHPFLQTGQLVTSIALSLPAMLDGEYDLPPEAIKEIQQNIEQIARRFRRVDSINQYTINERGNT
jgi:hypothetical protein